MKNITLALDDDTYRRARITAAQLDESVSSLVKKYLNSLSAVPDRQSRLQEQESLLDSIWQRHRGFSSTENMSRDDLHERHALR